MQTNALKAKIETIAQGRVRTLIALAGPPGVGKSTFADQLARTLGPRAQVVPMDGFHRDNAWLDARGLRARKGAPETFDAVGFVQLVRGLRDGTVTKYPLFDRSIDGVVLDAGHLRTYADILIVEGNYLLLDDDAWRDLHPLWDMSIMLSVDPDTLRKRLIQRWIDHGFSPHDALKKARENDLKNAETVMKNSVPATHTIAN